MPAAGVFGYLRLLTITTFVLPQVGFLVSHTSQSAVSARPYKAHASLRYRGLLPVDDSLIPVEQPSEEADQAVPASDEEDGGILSQVKGVLEPAAEQAGGFVEGAPAAVGGVVPLVQADQADSTASAQNNGGDGPGSPISGSGSAPAQEPPVPDVQAPPVPFADEDTVDMFRPYSSFQRGVAGPGFGSSHGDLADPRSRYPVYPRQGPSINSLLPTVKNIVVPASEQAGAVLQGIDPDAPAVSNLIPVVEHNSVLDQPSDTSDQTDPGSAPEASPQEAPQQSTTPTPTTPSWDTSAVMTRMPGVNPSMFPAKRDQRLRLARQDIPMVTYAGTVVGMATSVLGVAAQSMQAGVAQSTPAAQAAGYLAGATEGDGAAPAPDPNHPPLMSYVDQILNSETLAKAIPVPDEALLGDEPSVAA